MDTESHRDDISFVIVAALFALIYKWVPQAKVAWADIWIGSGITAMLYTGGSMLIVVKLGHSPLVAFYGGAGSLVLVLLSVVLSPPKFFCSAPRSSPSMPASMALMSARPKEPWPSTLLRKGRGIGFNVRRVREGGG